MKKCLLTLIIGLIIIQVSAQNSWEKNKTAIIQFLKEEGFNPSENSETSIKFKKEGNTYYIYLDKNDPAFVILQGAKINVEPDQMKDAILAANLINTEKKVVKVFCSDNTLYPNIEMFIANPEHFFMAFYKSLGILSNISESIKEAYQKVTEVSPITITKLEVANTDSEGKLNVDYGGIIYSVNSMYLKPRITYNASQKGKTTLFVKLYSPSGLSTGTNSPNGYSYSIDVELNNSDTIALSGWGSQTKGHWKTGLYKFEVWHNNKCLISKDFTLY